MTARPNAPAGPLVAAAVVMVRDDNAILLVRHPARGDGHGGPGPLYERWTLPLAGLAEHETAEAAVERVLREQLHVVPGTLEFNDTITFVGRDGTRFVANAFLCVDWAGEPRVSPRDYIDAAWVAPDSAPAVVGALVDGLATWLATAFDAAAVPPTPAGLELSLDEARAQLLATVEASPPGSWGGAAPWSPRELLAHVADVEAYYASETRRLLTLPGHTWRPFNDEQWEEARALRALVNEPEPEEAIRARLERVRMDTRRWLASLTAAKLMEFGNHAERGAVRVADRIQKIADHDREHAERLRAHAPAGRTPNSTQSPGEA